MFTHHWASTVEDQLSVLLLHLLRAPDAEGVGTLAAPRVAAPYVAAPMTRGLVTLPCSCCCGWWWRGVWVGCWLGSRRRASASTSSSSAITSAITCTTTSTPPGSSCCCGWCVTQRVGREVAGAVPWTDSQTKWDEEWWSEVRLEVKCDVKLAYSTPNRD